jgi:hypothetical protein
MWNRSAARDAAPLRQCHEDWQQVEIVEHELYPHVHIQNPRNELLQ